MNSVHFVLVGGASALACAAIAWRNRRARPRLQVSRVGRIAPGRTSALFTVAGGIAFAGLGVFVASKDDISTGILVALLGLAIAGFMAPSLTRWHDVIWTSTSIEGPCHRFGPTLGVARTRIAWSAIARTGITLTGYTFVEAQDGRRVYWSELYTGYGALLATLAQRRPDL